MIGMSPLLDGSWDFKEFKMAVPTLSLSMDGRGLLPP
jgi:hypothetical protein